MDLINLKCPKCGTEMMVDAGQKEFTCEECGTVFDSNGEVVVSESVLEGQPKNAKTQEKEKMTSYNKSHHIKSSTRVLVESGILIAIATVLSMLKLAQLPYGGSITAASMLPIIIISYRHGIKTGLLSGFVYSLVQLVLGANNLSYATSWKGVVAIIMLDYVLAFLCLGLGGMFRREKDNQSLSLFGGALVCALLRYGCHVASGATVWAGLSVPTKDALIFSVAYNATYMLPETIVLVIVAYYLGSSLDFKAEQPVRLAKKAFSVSKLLYILAGLVFTAGLVFATVGIFSKLQNGDTGTWDVNGMSLVNWNLIIIVSAIAAVICAALAIAGAVISKKNKTLDNA